MNRSIARNRISDSQVRYRVKISGEECAPNTHESRISQTRLLREIVDTQELLTCGYDPFQLLRMSHTGEHWLIEAEAVVDELLED